jgi:hypothetical protein
MIQGGDSHTNSAALWHGNVDRFTLVTGFALLGDVWYAHSWLLERSFLVETTSPRSLYFGVILEGRDAVDFWNVAVSGDRVGRANAG